MAVEGCKAIGAPIVFVCFHDTLQWWKQGTASPEWLETVPAANVQQFFNAHKEEFSPEAVYRAKTWGRFRSEYQLSFVDVGLMPLVEEEVGEVLGRLIERSVSDLKARLGWREVTGSQGHWLLQTVFWLVSGKILRDKQVDAFADLDLTDVDEVFRRVAKHYGTDPFGAGSKTKLAALKESAHSIGQFSSLALTTTESLAYVYENTLISKETRSSLGTHSTPSFLVDYVVGNLAEWISQIPENQRSVFEPACGHAAFLVSAMRLLTELLPADKAIPSRRGPYLRSRLHGTDIDAFALELARLSLTLTDIPNPDGWDLSVKDMYVGERLAEQAQRNTIILANPPFENFEAEERKEYLKHGSETRFKNRATELLWRTIPNLSPGSVFGFVLPQTFLHVKEAAEVRQFLVNHCELMEICLFPDKVFSFSGAESVIILGRKLSDGPRKQLKTRYRHVREPQMQAFREHFDVSRTEIIPQLQFREAENCNLRVADLAEIWLALADRPVLGTVAEIGQGLFYRGRDLPPGAITYSDRRFAGAVRGFVHFDSALPITELPTPYWMNLSEDVVDRAVRGTTTGVPQLLLNYARVSRGPWRLKALIDRVGRPVTSRFMPVRPRGPSYSLEVLWALLNSPVANAYAYTHLSKRDNIVGDIRRIPVPPVRSSPNLDQSIKAYLDAVEEQRDATVLEHLLLRVDVEILKLYALPIELERALLDLFNGYERVGVPFVQKQYIPEELDHPIRLADFLECEADWSLANRERGRLIDKDIAGTISAEERTRLDALQAYADYHLDKVAPRPTQILDDLEDRLLADSAEKVRGADAGI